MYNEQFLAITVRHCNIYIFSCQDEADIFSAISHIGQNHKKFVGVISKDVFEEVNLLNLVYSP